MSYYRRLLRRERDEMHESKSPPERGSKLVGERGLQEPPAHWSPSQLRYQAALLAEILLLNFGFNSLKSLI